MFDDRDKAKECCLEKLVELCMSFLLVLWVRWARIGILRANLCDIYYRKYIEELI